MKEAQTISQRNFGIERPKKGRRANTLEEGFEEKMMGKILKM